MILKRAVPLLYLIFDPFWQLNTDGQVLDPHDDIDHLGLSREHPIRKHSIAGICHTAGVAAIADLVALLDLEAAAAADSS